MKNEASRTTYEVCDIQGNYHSISSQDLIAAAQLCIKEQFNCGETLTSPAASARYCQVLLAAHEHEVFYAIWLNSQHQVIGHGELFRGTIDGASVYPREVVKDGLACNASAVIFAHNHPSGEAQPSQADIQITERLKEALLLVDIRLLDHMVVGSDIVSMAERGLV